MIIDYKDVRFSFRDRQIKRRRRFITLFFLVLLVSALLVFFTYSSARKSLKAAEALLLQDRLPEGRARIAKSAASFFLKESWLELGALADLAAGRHDAALAKLAKLGKGRRGSAVDYAAFCKYFSDRAQYHNLKLYTDFLNPLKNDTVYWYQALCHAALLDAAGAGASLGRLSSAFRRENAKALSLLQRVLTQCQKGRITFVFDRKGLPLAAFNLSTRTTQSFVSGLRFPDFEADFKKGGARFYHLTLDRDLQEKVTRLFADFYGTFVLLDLKDNGITVAFSRPRNEKPVNSAFAEEFEPGSIIKVLTLLAYLGDSRQGLFPFQCRGPLVIAGQTFYDALAHGEVKDATEATALSCNLSFARMGMAVGFEALSRVLEKFFFNAPPLHDQFLWFNNGHFQPVGQDKYRLANLSVGLQEIAITTLQAAVLAAIISRDGAYFPPFLIDHTNNILDLGVYNHAQLAERLFADGLQFRKVKSAMRMAVDHEMGTARRAKTEGMPVAAKTGTAGKKGQLDAIMIGFFPADDPQYAFAFRLEGGGRAEFNGAYLLKNFLSAFLGD